MCRPNSRKAERGAPFYLFIKDHGRYGVEAIVVANPTFAEIEALRGDGFEEIWNGAPTREAAADYGHEEYHAAERACSACGMFASVERCVGQRFHDGAQRFVVFNGYLCGQCEADHDTFRVRYA